MNAFSYKKCKFTFTFAIFSVLFPQTFRQMFLFIKASGLNFSSVASFINFVCT